MKDIVVIGGGHGLSAILSGIRDMEDTSISAIVTVADDGGSTGRLRKRYTIPAMGDIRNVICAMSDSEPLMHELMKQYGYCRPFIGQSDFDGFDQYDRFF